MKKNVRKVYQRLCCLLLCLTLLFGASLSGHAYTYIPPDPDEPVMGVSRIVGLTPASMTDEGKKMLEQADSPVCLPTPLFPYPVPRRRIFPSFACFPSSAALIRMKRSRSTEESTTSMIRTPSSRFAMLCSQPMLSA